MTPKQSLRILIALTAGCFLILISGCLDPVNAHSWFTNLVDPITGGRCCGGTDCAEVPPELIESGAISETRNGFIVSLTLEQARYFNKAVTIPITQFVPMTRVQSSLTGGFALCIWRNEVQCFFAPSNS
jgi:hypothetical protein